MKKVSIITVCFNEVSNIGKTIDSVLEQTFTDYELIIIDGQSTDGTVEKIKTYGDKINKFISEKDKDLFDAQNKGIRLADGEYEFFLNAGDFLYSHRVLEKVFENNPKADIVYGDLVVEMKNGYIFRKKSPAKITKQYMIADSLPHQATFFKKKLMDKVGFYDLSYVYAADYDLTLRALYEMKCSLEYMPVPVAQYNLQGQSAQLSNRKDFMRERDFSRKKYMPGYEKLKPFNPFIAFIYKWIPLTFTMLRSKFSDKYLHPEKYYE